MANDEDSSDKKSPKEECEQCGGEAQGYDAICLSCRRQGWIHDAQGELVQVEAETPFVISLPNGSVNVRYHTLMHDLSGLTLETAGEFKQRLIEEGLEAVDAEIVITAALEQLPKPKPSLNPSVKRIDRETGEVVPEAKPIVTREGMVQEAYRASGHTQNLMKLLRLRKQELWSRREGDDGIGTIQEPYDDLTRFIDKSERVLNQLDKVLCGILDSSWSPGHGRQLRLDSEDEAA